MQIYGQLLARLLAAGQDPQDAVAAPRWLRERDMLLVEDGLPPLDAVLPAGLTVVPMAVPDLAGHAHAIRCTQDGLLAGATLAPTASRSETERLRFGARRVGWESMLAMLLVAASVAGADPVAVPPPVQASPSFSVRGGRITAELHEVPRDAALRELATTLGADVWGEVEDPAPVSHRFDEAPVARALDRLLGAQNFLLRYDGDGRLARIELLGLSVPRATSNARAPGPRGRPATFDQLLARHRPVPVTGALRTAARRDTAPLPQLIALAILQPDPAVRAEAARTVLRAIEGDASLRQAMHAWLRSADAASVAALAKQRARIRAADVLGLVAREARTPLLRTRAAQGLAQLRSPTATAQR